MLATSVRMVAGKLHCVPLDYWKIISREPIGVVDASLRMGEAEYRDR